MTDQTQIAPQRPLRIGKYQIRRQLGAGAMGVVYEAHDADIDRIVAIKTIHRHLIDTDSGADWLARFSREARAAGRVLHPNLVTIFDYLEQDGQPFLVMERLQAHTLEDRLAQPDALTLGDVGTMFAQILDGLSAIHAEGIIHGDMKPAKVMLTENGTVKLTDFGIARFSQADRTSAGMIGTSSFMAPEQFSGEEVDDRADIYATGVVLYKVHTGRLPYEGGGIEAVMRASKGETVDPPSALVPGLPRALDAVVMTAISPELTRRHASAAQMRKALAAALEMGNPGQTTIAAAKPTGPAPQTMIGWLSNETMRGLEESLVGRIGPIGKIVARRAAQTAVDQSDLMEQILAEVAEGPEREHLRQAMARYLSADRSAGSVTQVHIAATTDALLPHLGPIARPLVRREAAASASLTQLLDRLADLNNEPDAHTRFLADARANIPNGSEHS
ncbi:serine/threonine protein kinase [Roseivivax lentus]|uniref:Serine/threonine protein kinase n=1 Tax=Roseivivax lentus TaxID=633194 RepID=A0A1N7NSU3_9RHOB|nr:serine/threonine-protein kinase [Roseivivax lentus]SIT01435.1 serine/threonine protein kinase [Roseivivax lentus]